MEWLCSTKPSELDEIKHSFTLKDVRKHDTIRLEFRNRNKDVFDGNYYAFGRELDEERQDTTAIYIRRTARPFYHLAIRAETRNVPGGGYLHTRIESVAPNDGFISLTVADIDWPKITILVFGETYLKAKIVEAARLKLKELDLDMQYRMQDNSCMPEPQYKKFSSPLRIRIPEGV